MGGQADRAYRGIEGGKHFRRDQHIGTAESVEKRGFAGVGIANQGYRTERNCLAGFATQRALFADGFNAPLNLTDPVADPAAIGLQLLFARAANTDAAAGASATTAAPEPRHFRAAPGDSRGHIIQLRKLDLKLTFATAGVSRKNIEDKLSAVNYTASRGALDVSLLHRREIAVKDNERCVAHFRFDSDFFKLAASHQSGRVRSITHLKDATGDFRAGAARQLF
jgi:hypothetical protein